MSQLDDGSVNDGQRFGALSEGSNSSPEIVIDHSHDLLNPLPIQNIDDDNEDPSKKENSRKTSASYQYFKYDSNSKFAVCQIEKCSQPNAASFKTEKDMRASNLKRHLSKHHLKIYEKVEEEDELIKKKQDVKSRSQPKIDKVIANLNSPQIEFNRLLAIFFSTANISYNTIASDAFVNLIRHANKSKILLDIPGPKGLVSEMKTFSHQLKSKIMTSLQSASRIALSSDIWSNKGLNGSYLGIIATYYDKLIERRRVVLLAVRKFTTIHHYNSHVFEIAKQVASEFEIPPKKVWRILSDGGSNMVAAFNVDSYVDKWNKEEDNEKGETKNLDVSNQLDENAMTFSDTSEEESLDAVANLDYKYMPCFIHSLLCGLKASLTASSIKSLIDKVQRFESSINRSTTRTQTLETMGGKGLISFSNTRWNVVYLVIGRILELKPFIVTLCAEDANLECFTGAEWIKIERLHQFLKPLYTLTNMSSKEKDTSISAIVVHIKELLYDEIPEFLKDNFLKPAAKILESELTRRFAHIIVPGSDHFDSIFFTSTFLDPRYNHVLESHESEEAKNYILSSLKNINLNSSQDEESGPTPAKIRFRDRMRQEKKKRLPRVNQELIQYEQLLETLTIDESQDPIDFWKRKIHDFPSLAPFALDAMSMPSSTAPMERVFSYCGIATLGLRNRLKGKNLETEILIARNRKEFEV